MADVQYFNQAQQLLLAMNTRDEVAVCGRGFGKGAVQAGRLLTGVQGMPGSSGGFVAPSVKRCLTNILPSMLIHLERWGFKRDVHYIVGRKPWKALHWKQPYFQPANWENTIAFYNGSVCNIISQDRTGTSNSMSLDYLIMDEAKFLNPDQLRRFLLRPDWADNLTGALRVDVTAPAFKQLEKGQVAKFSGSLTVTHEVVQE